MAGSATITGQQNYILGIGHPRTEAPVESAPLVGAYNSNNKFTGVYDASGNLLNMSYILAQSAVPVMIAQSGLLASGATDRGFVIPAQVNGGMTVTFSALSGSVTVTLGNAILAGSASDVGRQLVFFDSSSSVWRSALITASGTTTMCTATLSSTYSSLNPGVQSVGIGNPLPTNYTNGIWVYLPANAVVGGAAGFYWCVATSTATANGILQVTTAYQSSMGVPSIPTGFSNAVGSGANFTGVTSAINVATQVVPGGSLGSNGSLRCNAQNSVAATATVKNINHTFGGSLVSAFSGSGTTNITLIPSFWVRNAGVQNSQVTSNWAGINAFTTTVPYRNTIDTTANQTFAFMGQTAVATDFVILEGFTLEVLPRA